MKHKDYAFPSGKAFVGDVDRPYKTLGVVRAKADYQTLDPNHDEEDLCKNYYNKSVLDLIRFAREKGGDAVIQVRSVVFYEDGKHEFHTAPECSDDGMEGQVLTQGTVVKFLETGSQ